jgi:hypothetical protein
MDEDDGHKYVHFGTTILWFQRFLQLIVWNLSVFGILVELSLHETSHSRRKCYIMYDKLKRTCHQEFAKLLQSCALY